MDYKHSQQIFCTQTSMIMRMSLSGFIRQEHFQRLPAFVLLYQKYSETIYKVQLPLNQKSVLHSLRGNRDMLRKATDGGFKETHSQLASSHSVCFGGG